MKINYVNNKRMLNIDKISRNISAIGTIEAVIGTSVSLIATASTQTPNNLLTTIAYSTGACVYGTLWYLKNKNIKNKEDLEKVKKL